MKRVCASAAASERAGPNGVTHLGRRFARALAAFSDEELYVASVELACPACWEPLRAAPTLSARAVFAWEVCCGVYGAEHLLEAA